jgi:putative ABC transport system permease protein
MGWAVDLLSGDKAEIDRLNIQKALVRGRMPDKADEVLLSDEFAQRLDVEPGNTVTLLGSTMYGSMAMHNFEIAGTVAFGISLMDRGAIVMDITDAQTALDMDDSAGEILGYLATGVYDDEKAAAITQAFNKQHAGSENNEFAPMMLRLKEQNDLAGMLDYANSMKSMVVTVFVMAMSIVLWNTGLIGGIRRYGEIGVRLAIGEYKGRIYRSLLWESVMIGIAGSTLGTMIGLGIAYILQTKGIDVGGMMKNATIMLPTVFRAHITRQALYIGFLPGLFATVTGTMLSGIGIYRRQTARLFKELEA